MRKLVIFIVLSSALALAQGAQRIGQATQNSNGFVKVLPGAAITVCTSPTCGLASIYFDSGLTKLITQPLFADANGNYQYYTVAGNYLENIDSPGTVPTVTLVSTALGAGSLASPPPIGNVTPNTGVFTSLSATSFTGGSVYASNNSSIPGTFLRSDATLNGGTNQINALESILTANPSGSTANWAKNAFEGYCQNKDTTSTGTFQDCIGVLGAAELFSGQTIGRAAGLNGVATVDSSADGTAVAVEADVVNNGSVSSNPDGATAKLGSSSICAGPNACTAGVHIAGNIGGGGVWEKGINMEAIASGGIPWHYVQTGSTTCSVTAAAGSGATCTILTGGTDLWGTVRITAGSGASSSGLFTLTFSQNLGVNGPVCTWTMGGPWNGRATLMINTLPVPASEIMQWDNNSVNLTSTSSYYAQYICMAD